MCDVPASTTATIYGDLPARLTETPQQLVARIADRVTNYYREISNGAYALTMVAGRTIPMADGDDDQACVQAALDASSAGADVVLAVATAEHVEGRSGGWGRPGTRQSCAADCPARVTGRAAYVGASDFHADWGQVPLLDLIEHELGHALGLPHSGSPVSGGTEYPSALDLMSNSAAPGESDPTRRDAPATLAINLFDLGWLPLDSVVVADPATEVELAPSTGAAGIRLMILPLDENRLLTVEFLTPTGFNDHLPRPGIAVHLIDDRAGGNVLRVQDTLGSSPPHSDLLAGGETLSIEGWDIEVGAIGATAHLAVTDTRG
jgi:hypothetical protein